jgi:hypothetical protein
MICSHSVMRWAVMCKCKKSVNALRCELSFVFVEVHSYMNGKGFFLYLVFKVNGGAIFSHPYIWSIIVLLDNHCFDLHWKLPVHKLHQGV